jgi:endonuclease I
MKKLLAIFLLLAIFRFSFSQIPPGYYDAANGLTGQPLQAALHNIIKDHTSITYSAIINAFSTTDVKTGNVVWDMYSDIPGGTPPYVYHYNTGDECGNYSAEGDCYNREHSWPQSWFGSSTYPMYSDLFHIYPTDGYVNGKRNNYPYGKVNSPTWTSDNGSKLGPCVTAGYTGTVFEPRDEYKGDFARSYFYMSVRYYTEDSGWPGSDATTGSQLKPWHLAMMLQWSSQDPVSQKEIDRNNAVYAIQNNRNPFIDHPEYAGEIWGSGTGIGEAATQSLTIWPNPVHDICYILLPDPTKSTETHISISSGTGMPVECHFTCEGERICVDAGKISAGIYVVTVSCSGSAVYHGKIVKE